MRDAWLNHKPSDEKTATIEELRKRFIDLRDWLETTLIQGRYKSIAYTELETAQLFAVRSIIASDD